MCARVSLRTLTHAVRQVNLVDSFVDDLARPWPLWHMCGDLYGVTWDLVASTREWFSEYNQSNPPTLTWQNAEVVAKDRSSLWGSADSQEDTRTRFWLHQAGRGHNAYRCANLIIAYRYIPLHTVTYRYIPLHCLG